MPNRSQPSLELSAFRPVSRTGVIYCSTEAAKRGFGSGDLEWCNLGQGQPEAGALPGAPPRITTVTIDEEDHEYAPVAGLWELRESIAGLYNRLFRRGMPSQYSAENVAVCGGGRLSLARTAAALGAVNMGHFLPDYTAYEELLDIFREFTPIPILLERDRGYQFSTEELRKEITGRGLSALLFSNPCNPTGKVVGGDELAAWVGIARELDCALLLDEFYSHYVWRPDLVAEGGIASAARYIEDVDRDPVVILDGLTKNWRYPGWRVTWSLQPKEVTESVTSAGSFLDGGGSRPLQRAAIDLLDYDFTRRETAAIREVFGKKRRRLLTGLRDLGLKIDVPPDGTFYVWASAEHLPPAINDGMSFFHAALDRKVICVPGEFFGVDPGHRRGRRQSSFRHHLRFSFGPGMDVIDRALGKIGELIEEAAAGRLQATS